MEASVTWTKNCNACPIRHRAICATCDRDELQLLEEIKYYKDFKAGEQIVWAGDQMDFVGSVVSGTATLEKLMDDGRKQTLGLLLPSDFIGRTGGANALYDVTAITDVTVCCFRKERFEKLVQTTPHIAQRFLEMALDELDAARDWMLLLGRKTAREKIATFLMMVVRRTSVEGVKTNAHERHITLPLTREAMADFLGLTIETVSRQFSSLKAEGIIELNGKRDAFIPDISALQAQASIEAD